MLIFSLNRHYTFYTSYDQGLFNQVFWNNLHGQFFQSSLTSANSVGVTEDREVPITSFLHLAHHFVPNFLLWLPIYAVFPAPVTLIVLQVTLITVAGVLLYALARHYLEPNLSLWITIGYFGASAVIGPTFANFYEQCQIPLFAFGMLLALEKRRWLWFWLLTVLLLGVREDAGFVSFSIGLYLLLSRRYPRVGLLLCLVSFGYVTAITNLVIPRLSDDSSRLYLAVRFRQFVRGDTDPSTLQVLWGMLTHPKEFLESLLTPFDRRAFYLFRHWLSLALVPALSPSAWILSGVPLLALFLQTGISALSITIRYALAVVPGVFYGAILWWSVHPDRFKPRLRRIWTACIVLSIVMTIVSNPNRAFYFLIPDSIVPWVHVSLPRQWEHSGNIRQVLQQIPANASVSATTYLIPPLSSRREVVRLPGIKLRNDQGQVIEAEYLVADLWQLQQYQVAFKEDRDRLRAILPVFDQLLASSRYGVQAFRDGVVLLHQGTDSQPTSLTAWTQLRQQLEPIMKEGSG